MPVKKTAEVRRIERIIEDHGRRATQAQLAGQKDRAKLHQRQSALWAKALARSSQLTSGVTETVNRTAKEA